MVWGNRFFCFKFYSISFMPAILDLKYQNSTKKRLWIYNIQTSWDQVNWEETVAINCQERPLWQKFVFQERCVVYVKITLEQIPSSRSVNFHRTDFEIPSNT